MNTLDTTLQELMKHKDKKIQKAADELYRLLVELKIKTLKEEPREEVEKH